MTCTDTYYSGKDNFAADREAAARQARAIPQLPWLARPRPGKPGLTDIWAWRPDGDIVTTTTEVMRILGGAARKN